MHKKRNVHVHESVSSRNSEPSQVPGRGSGRDTRTHEERVTAQDACDQLQSINQKYQKNLDNLLPKGKSAHDILQGRRASVQSLNGAAALPPGMSPPGVGGSNMPGKGRTGSESGKNGAQPACGGGGRMRRASTALAGGIAGLTTVKQKADVGDVVELDAVELDGASLTPKARQPPPPEPEMPKDNGACDDWLLSAGWTVAGIYDGLDPMEC